MNKVLHVQVRVTRLTDRLLRHHNDFLTFFVGWDVEAGYSDTGLRLVKPANFLATLPDMYKYGCKDILELAQMCVSV